jgi:hypothetical protein
MSSVVKIKSKKEIKMKKQLLTFILAVISVMNITADMGGFGSFDHSGGLSSSSTSPTSSQTKIVKTAHDREQAEKRRETKRKKAALALQKKKDTKAKAKLDAAKADAKKAREDATVQRRKRREAEAKHGKRNRKDGVRRKGQQALSKTRRMAVEHKTAVKAQIGFMKSTPVSKPLSDREIAKMPKASLLTMGKATEGHLIIKRDQLNQVNDLIAKNKKGLKAANTMVRKSEASAQDIERLLLAQRNASGSMKKQADKDLCVAHKTCKHPAVEAHEETGKLLSGTKNDVLKDLGMLEDSAFKYFKKAGPAHLEGFNKRELEREAIAKATGKMKDTNSHRLSNREEDIQDAQERLGFVKAAPNKDLVKTAKKAKSVMDKAKKKAATKKKAAPKMKKKDRNKKRAGKKISTKKKAASKKKKAAKKKAVKKPAKKKMTKVKAAPKKKMVKKKPAKKVAKKKVVKMKKLKPAKKKTSVLTKKNSGWLGDRAVLVSPNQKNEVKPAKETTARKRKRGFLTEPDKDKVAF